MQNFSRVGGFRYNAKVWQRPFPVMGYLSVQKTPTLAQIPEIGNRP